MRSWRAAEDLASTGCKTMTEISDNVMELVMKVGIVLHTVSNSVLEVHK
jgi:hypothetical protein